MKSGLQILDIAHIVQLAVAPVFLLSGIGIILTVLTNRMSRIMDRAHVIEDRLSSVQEPAKTDLNTELYTLSRRARLINLAITLSTLCGLLICLVIVTLFVGHLVHLVLSWIISVLFIASMLAFAGAFVSFLREIFLATATLRIGPYKN